MLASLLFPYDGDAPSHIDGWLKELEREKCVIRYKVNGDNYMEICNWLTHQKIDKPSPSKIAPFANVREDSPSLREHSSLDGIKDQGRDQGEDHSFCGETGQPSSPPVDSVVAPSDETAVLEFPCDGVPGTWRLTASQAAEWQRLFPSLDLVAECRSAYAWVLADSSRRKTARGMCKFLVGWFGRAQNRGNGRSNGRQARPKAVGGIGDDES